MSAQICSVFTISAGLAFALSDTQAGSSNTVWFLIGVGGFGLLVSILGIYGSVKLRAGLVKFVRCWSLAPLVYCAR